MVQQIAPSQLQQVRSIDSGNGYAIDAIGQWKVSRVYYHDVPVTDYLGRFQFVLIEDRDRRAVLETKIDKVHNYRYTEMYEVVDQREWVLAPTKIPENERALWEQEMREEATPEMPGDAYARMLYARKGFRERPKRLAKDGSGFMVDTPFGPVNEEALRSLVASGQMTGQTFGNTEEEFASGLPGDPNDITGNPGSTELSEDAAPGGLTAQPLDLVTMLGADPDMQQRALDALVESGVFQDKNGNPLVGAALKNKITAKTPEKVDES